MFWNIFLILYSKNFLILYSKKNLSSRFLKLINTFFFFIWDKISPFYFFIGFVYFWAFFINLVLFGFCLLFFFLFALSQYLTKIFLDLNGLFYQTCWINTTFLMKQHVWPDMLQQNCFNNMTFKGCLHEKPLSYD